MSFADALELALLDHVLGGPDYSRLATVYVGLSTTTPTDAGGNFTEPSSGAYARVAVTNNPTNWPGAAAGLKSNGVAVTFPQATADWSGGVNMTHFGIFAASSGGTPFMTGALTEAKPVLNGDTPSFAVGDIDVTLD